VKDAGKKSVARRSKLLLLMGFFFFINPVPLGFDFLPDVFGCILLYFGLTQIAYFDGEIEKARKYVLYLFALEAVHWLSMSAFVSTSIGSNRMLAVSVFAIGQAILYILIFKALFGGISYFSMRNNLNATLAKCDGCAFMSYLAFFVRIAATVIPELLYILELESVQAETFEEIENIADIMSAKPLIVLLCSFIALVTGIAWYVSVRGLTVSLFKEGSELMDSRYSVEYTSKPRLVRMKKLRYFSVTLYAALVFSTDIVFDSNHITPVWVMFLLLIAAYFFAKDLGGLKYTPITAAVPAVIFFIADAFKDKYVPNGAVYIHETDLWIVFVNLAIAVLGAISAILCIRFFLKELNGVSVYLTGKSINPKKAYIAYCVSLTLWTAGYVVPYYFGSVSTLRFIATAVFIWQTGKLIVQINDNYAERISLYGEDEI